MFKLGKSFHCLFIFCNGPDPRCQREEKSAMRTWLWGCLITCALRYPSRSFSMPCQEEFERSGLWMAWARRTVNKGRRSDILYWNGHVASNCYLSGSSTGWVAQEGIPKHMMRPGDEIRNNSHTVEQNRVIVWLRDPPVWSWRLRPVGGTEYPGETTTFWRTKKGKRKVKKIRVHDMRWYVTFCGWSAS